MPRFNNQAIIIFFTALTLFLLYYLSAILTPFMLGGLLAYLADPLVKRLEKKQIPHLLSVILVFSLIVLFFVVLILMLFPLIQNQVMLLIDEIPRVSAQLQENVMPWLRKVASSPEIKKTVTESVPKAGDVVQTVVQSGGTIITWAINIVLTPIITFYLLRDWDKVCDGIKALLPQKIKPTTLELAHEYDEVLGAFFRGQLLVMLALSIIYGIGLTLVGLNLGFILGVIGGVLSIVPYLGSLFVVVTSSVAALIQFQAWEPLVWVWIVFMLGQAVEGYVLTPYLVGGRIGLHPVAVIFAIMAGGSLFGFFGILLALPVAALIMVLFRHTRRKYHARIRASHAHR